MANKTRYLSVSQIVNSGLLQEINRQFLHPLGYALEVELPTERLAIQDHSDDPEGMIFDEVEYGKWLDFDRFTKDRHFTRLLALGYVQQPAPLST